MSITGKRRVGFSPEVVKSERPLIAIVGSIDESRIYDPPLARVDKARQACEQLGCELATRGCRIVVYSNAPRFIEAHVVRGYLGSGQARPRSIQVRYPYDAAIDFAELEGHRSFFDVRPDSASDWVVSFYRSLAETQGVVLLGGGWSTYVAGLIALSYRIPLLAVASFGGNAKKAWAALDRDKGLATSEEIAVMAQDWHADSAGVLINGLLATGQRRLDADREGEEQARSSSRRSVLSAAVAGMLLLLAIAAIPLSWGWRASTGGPLAALVFAPLLAGAAGSMLRVVSDAGRDWTKTAVLGFAAGGIAVLLFVATQIAATPDILNGEGAHRLLLFAIPSGFIAGFTFDVVYEKLKRSDVVHTGDIDAPSGDASTHS